MIVFLTSSPSGPLDNSRQVNGLDDKNGFVENLHRVWKDHSRVLMVSAFPDNYEAGDEMTSFFQNVFNYRGLSCSMDLWDHRIKDVNINEYDAIILGGGHVPTQNKFFHEIHLRKKMKSYDGIVIGISAGSMNSADIVYTQPEEAGEAIDPNYKRYLEGLNLTATQMIPHTQMIRHWRLDGLLLFEDITFKESYGKEFIALVDGSYILIENNKEWIYGESYLVKDGSMNLLSQENDKILYKENGVRI